MCCSIDDEVNTLLPGLVQVVDVTDIEDVDRVEGVTIPTCGRFLISSFFTAFDKDSQGVSREAERL